MSWCKAMSEIMCVHGIANIILYGTNIVFLDFDGTPAAERAHKKFYPVEGMCSVQYMFVFDSIDLRKFIDSTV